MTGQNHNTLIRKFLSDYPEEFKTERLSSMETVKVATKLLHDASVNQVYVDDIIQCVVEMVPQMEERQRFPFLCKIYAFISEAGNFNGEKTFKAFNNQLLKQFEDHDLMNLADVFRDGMQPNYVTSCEAHMWGLVNVIPVLPTIYQREYAQDILRLARHTDLQGIVIKGLSRLIFKLDREERTDMTYYLAEDLKKSDSAGIKRFIISFLDNVTSSLPEDDRILIADSVAHVLFDTDIGLVRKGLEFFERNVQALPRAQRYPYALMISGLATDISVGYEVRETLACMMKYISDVEEKERLQWAIDHAQEQINKKIDRVEESYSSELDSYGEVQARHLMFLQRK